MDEVPERELTVPENIVKVVLAGVSAYLVKHFVEKSVENGFRNHRKGK